MGVEHGVAGCGGDQALFSELPNRPADGVPLWLSYFINNLFVEHPNVQLRS